MRSFFAHLTFLTLLGGLPAVRAGAQATPTPPGAVVDGPVSSPDAPPPQAGIEQDPAAAEPGADAPQADPEGQPAPAAPTVEAPSQPNVAQPGPAEVAEPAGPVETEGALAAPAASLPAADAASTPLPVATETDVPSPGEMSDRLAAGLDENYDGDDTWTAPTSVLALHGYMRLRGELMDTFWLGRHPHLLDTDRVNLNGLLEAGQPDVQPEALGPDPFTRFRPFERTPPRNPDRTLSCVDEARLVEHGASSLCEVDTLQFANVRLRLSPEINLTEDVRVRATFDVLDNVMAGSAPRSFYGSSPLYESTFADTTLPAGGGGDGTGVLGSSIVARRAWAEVRNRDLGELRFGRMPQHWGLGMVFNNGDGLDQDFSTDLDRVMGITKLAGFYLSASYDFIAEGLVGGSAQGSIAGAYDLYTPRPDIDGSQLDDVDQFSFSVASVLSDEERAAALERGELVLNGGLHFTLRHQDAVAAVLPQSSEPTLISVSSTRYTPDLWGQLLYPGVRIEAELAWHLGTLQRRTLENDGQTLDLTSFGAALETEFRFLEERLGLYLNTGLATGDEDVEGLSAGADFVDQLTDDTTISTFSFHPSYQVDMILWRNIMRQVTGAYYLRPGVSYDFVRTPFGELFGARLDVVWSRASSFLQSPGNSESLGLELNAKVYWRSEDGADPEDGYHASVQYGVLFPMAGLGFPEYAGIKQDLGTAQQIRLLLGVVF